MSYAQPRDSPATGSSLTSVGINWGWHSYSNCVQIESGHCYLHNREHSSGEITRSAFVSLFFNYIFFKKGTIVLRSKIQGHSMYAFVQCAHQSTVFRSFLVTNEFRCTEDSAVPQGFRPVPPLLYPSKRDANGGVGGDTGVTAARSRESDGERVSLRERVWVSVWAFVCVRRFHGNLSGVCLVPGDRERERERWETRRKLSLVKGRGGMR